MAPLQTKPEKGCLGQLLCGLGAQETETIIAAASRKPFRCGDIIVEAGQPARRLFLLWKGSVKVYRVTRDGHEVVLAWLVPGESFGLGTLLSKPIGYLGTAESLEISQILVWDQIAVQRLASAYPKLAENALRIALQYVANFSQRHVDLVCATAEQRLARTLATLGTRSGHPTPAGVHVEVKNEQLAALSDISPFTTSRLLKNWDRQGAIKKSRGQILIQYPEKLLVE